MVWGGSLNSRGSNYLRKLREADKAIEFLEKFKEKVSSEEREHFKKTINIIVKYVNKLVENRQEDD